MIRLEALQARHGDCLLLHWGDASKPYMALIDGGPSAVYKQVLRPRLLELADQCGGGLRLDLVMLSHIDDDHIKGLLDLAKEIEDRRTGADGDEEFPPIWVKNLWHNSLEDLLEYNFSSSSTQVVTAAIAAVGNPPADMANDSDLEEHFYNMVLASVPQGQELHGYAVRNGWSVNEGFKDPPLVMCKEGSRAKKIQGLRLTVIAPAIEEIEKLRKVWKEKRVDGATAAYLDRSPYNLSSIVVLAEYGERRILLTGDARGDLILDGLARNKFLDGDGCIHVDVLKLPHHGSGNNVEQSFFERVTADHYVVSGDQVKFPNPAIAAMEWLHDARGDDDYKVHCTYELEDMRALFRGKLITPAAELCSVSVTLDGSV